MPSWVVIGPQITDKQREHNANTKTTKTMLTGCIASRHTGVITRRVKEKGASLHSK